jgi:transcriptional regulator with XRE-family HTH domain
MNLQNVYEKEGRKGLVRIAEKVGANPSYLWQIATNRREPSPELARKLVAVDRRLTLADIFSQQAA